VTHTIDRYGGSLKMAEKKHGNPLTVRISETTKAEIKQAAQAQGISPNKFAANALQAAVHAAQQNSKLLAKVEN
jgi:predicted HicB family RNase H-like nuclease